MIGLEVLYVIGGAFFAAVAVLSARDASNPKRWKNTAFWGLFAISFVWLGKIGAGPGTDPVETIIGRFLTAYYFLFFLTMPLWTKLDSTKPVPERVTTHD